MRSNIFTIDQEIWDFIIVGAGSAGSVLADRLSELDSNRVLVLEAGPPDSSLLKLLGLSYYLNLSRYEWGYRSQPDPTRNMRTDLWRRGRIVGGTGSINGMNYVRGTRADYDQWAAMGNKGWSADDVMPLFQAIERCEPRYHVRPDLNYRGESGPLPVREAGRCHKLTEAYIEAVQGLGFPRTDDYNGARQEGVGYGQFNQRRGLRRTSADVFLKPSLRRSNLQLVTNAHVHRLKLKAGRVTGVIYERDGRLREASAGKVILCAGAINTPQLLLLSGIGDAETLQSLGIETVINRPLVGRNLMEHPILRTGLRVTVPSFNPTQGLWQKVGFLAKFLFEGQGPIATLVEAQSFLRTSNQEPVPDVQVLFSPLGAVFSKETTSRNGVKIFDFPGVSIHIVKSYPESRGQIRLRSSEPRAAPLIEPNLLGDDRDVETLVRSVGLFRRIVAAQPLSDMISEVIEPSPDLISREQLVEYVRDVAGLAYHPAGTCRMGVDDQAVVTPDLKVRGIDNLWIADASIMPRLVSGNIYAACLMIGEKLGRQLRA